MLVGRTARKTRDPPETLVKKAGGSSFYPLPFWTLHVPVQLNYVLRLIRYSLWVVFFRYLFDVLVAVNQSLLYESMTSVVISS